MFRRVLVLLLSLQVLTATAAIENNKSLVFQTDPNSKIIKSPNAEAIKKAEKLLANGNEAIKNFPRTTVLDSNASTLIRKAMDIEAGVKTTKYMNTETASNQSPISATTSIEKPSSKYFEVLDKDFSSIENDSWADATANTNEVVNYFFTERSLHGKDNALLGDYCDLVTAFAFYLSAGTELDEAEQPNYSHAKSLFESARNSASKINNNLRTDNESKAISAIVDKFIKQLDTEITYINEMLHGANHD